MGTEKDMYAMMVKLDERQRTLFNMMSRVEKHLEKLNGTVQDHERALAKLSLMGTISIVVFPIIVNIIMGVVK